ncbi:hypothetical protein BH24ACT26_BH24ACT26_23410 [soil metagenome]
MPDTQVDREPRSFGVTFDYRCPFARNAHEHVVAGLAAGAPWNVSFLAFSLNQVHVERGEADVWRDPDRAPDLLAMRVGIAVRDGWPDAFLRTHNALFAARHDRGLDLRDEAVLHSVLEEQGLDARAVLDESAAGASLETFKKEHEAAVSQHRVFGVPTFVVGGQAAFIRVMSRPRGDGELAIRTIERILDLVAGWPDLNELKLTKIPR